MTSELALESHTKEKLNAVGFGNILSTKYADVPYSEK
ncbi:MAG: hypothetical protein HeimC2_33540 [Candidatus Heimdallarchaeota archaeon LC_2]|nr:MAG: hypothetical protein HeimC2_33540 [Candidatus Heimdallarchaeota archaeon LC_2]